MAKVAKKNYENKDNRTCEKYLRLANSTNFIKMANITNSKIEGRETQKCQEGGVECSAVVPILQF